MVERNPSLWLATTEAREFDALHGDTKTAVVVVGSGITGLTTAYLLASAGVPVVVLEARRVCEGVTGHTTAKVTSLHSTIYSRLSEKWGDEVSAVYAAANQAAISKVRELVELNRIDCELEEASAFTYTESAEGVASIEAEVEAATRAGLAAFFTTATDLPYEVRGAVQLDHQAQFHPRRYCLGLVEVIRRDGGIIYEGTRAVAVDADSGTVTTERGIVTADVVVLASHIPFGLAGAYFARMEPTRSYAVAFHSEAERVRGMYISIDQPTRSIRSTESGWTIVGGESHKVGHDADTEKRYEALTGWSKDRFNATSFGFRWSAQDYRSADRLPFIGRLTANAERVLVATGFGKWGMTNGTLAAMIIADLAQGRPNPWAETFDSTRIALAQGAGGVVREGADFARRFVVDRIGAIGAPDTDDLMPGTGAVASMQGHKVAAFRGEDGSLHAVSATCTHLGCQVSFNTAERTWDCPCHGSRFDVDGRVLQGPAVKDLPTKQI